MHPNLTSRFVQLCREEVDRDSYLKVNSFICLFWLLLFGAVYRQEGSGGLELAVWICFIVACAASILVVYYAERETHYGSSDASLEFLLTASTQALVLMLVAIFVTYGPAGGRAVGLLVILPFLTLVLKLIPEILETDPVEGHPEH